MGRPIGGLGEEQVGRLGLCYVAISGQLVGLISPGNNSYINSLNESLRI